VPVYLKTQKFAPCQKLAAKIELTFREVDGLAAAAGMYLVAVNG